MAQYFKDKLKEKEKRDKDPKKNKLQTDLSWVTLVNNLIKQSGIFRGVYCSIDFESLPIPDSKTEKAYQIG